MLSLVQIAQPGIGRVLRSEISLERKDGRSCKRFGSDSSSHRMKEVFRFALLFEKVISAIRFRTRNRHLHDYVTYSSLEPHALTYLPLYKFSNVHVLSDQGFGLLMCFARQLDHEMR